MRIIALVAAVFFGYFLPLFDHLIYIFFLFPQDLSSQRAIYYLKNRQFAAAIKFLKETKSERKNLIFHTNTFLLVMTVLAFWLLTSSTSVWGIGLVLGAVIHVLLDRITSRLYHGPNEDVKEKNLGV